MTVRGARMRRGAVPTGLVLVALAGCAPGLPRLNRWAEAREALPPSVTAVRIDPRTLKPIDDINDEDGPAGEAPRGPEDAPTPE